MKISRLKRVRRYLNFYKNNYKFRTPFQILIDATFCEEARKSKVNIREQLPKYLGDAEVKLFTTACVISEIDRLYNVLKLQNEGKKSHAVIGNMKILKQYKAQRCGHEKNPINGAECFYSMVQGNNPNHYFIATQDPELSERCRELLGVPLLYLKYNAINLEKPSLTNMQSVDTKTQEKLKGSEYQHETIQKLKAEVFGEQSVLQKKRKKVKGPNPLSCKKKKVKAAEPAAKIRKRQRHKRVKSKTVVCE